MAAGSADRICHWSELAPSVQAALAPVLAPSTHLAAARWQREFQANPSSAAGLVIVYAALTAAGIWPVVGSLLNAWGVGLFFTPAPGLIDELNAKPNFLPLRRQTLYQRWAHHWYWEHAWMQRNLKHAAIHVGVSRVLENGWYKAEVHLDLYNSFYQGFHPWLALRHLRAEVIGRRRHAPEQFARRLAAQGIAVPRYQAEMSG